MKPVWSMNVRPSVGSLDGVLPVMSAGATDGSFLRNAGIPTYGHSGMAIDVGESRIHGKDERVPVKSFYEGDEYLYRLVKMLAGGGTN